MAMEQKKIFGTDGVRGKVGYEPITPETLFGISWSAAKIYLEENPLSNKKTVLIGKDTRISGYMMEAIIQAGILSAGLNVQLVGPLPTPAIAYLTRTFGAAFGIVISASHNPYHDNGIKFFDSDGIKFNDDRELKIEAELKNEHKIVESKKLGKANRISDAQGRYVEYCKSTYKGPYMEGLNIILDCANGATYDIAPKVLSELGAKITSTYNEPNGFNINENCGSTTPNILRANVLKYNADLGIAFDGDGDRVMIVDNDGNLIDGDAIIFTIVKHLHKTKQLNGGVVGTVMTNLGFEQAYKKMGIPFVRAQVGDKYVMELLMKNKWQIGGEQSGHIILNNHTTTGDAVITALAFINAFIDMGHNCNEILSSVQKTNQQTRNIDFNFSKTEQKKIFTHMNKLCNDLQEKHSGNLRILLRKSGTENKLRLMVESYDKDMMENIFDEVLKEVE